MQTGPERNMLHGFKDITACQPCPSFCVHLKHIMNILIMRLPQTWFYCRQCECSRIGFPYLYYAIICVHSLPTLLVGQLARKLMGTWAT